jgi:hypothetical protein
MRLLIVQYIYLAVTSCHSLKSDYSPQYVLVVGCLVRHEENFTFTLPPF